MRARHPTTLHARPHKGPACAHGPRGARPTTSAERPSPQRQFAALLAAFREEVAARMRVLEQALIDALHPQVPSRRVLSEAPIDRELAGAAGEGMRARAEAIVERARRRRGTPR